MTRFKFKNLRKISWKILSRHKSLYFFCINYLHTTQFFDLCAQSTQEIKWLHGKNTTLISLTIQIFQVRASFNRWFSGSISGRISENFHFRSNWWYINGQGNIIFVLFYLLNLILCYYIYKGAILASLASAVALSIF